MLCLVFTMHYGLLLFILFNIASPAISLDCTCVGWMQGLNQELLKNLHCESELLSNRSQLIVGLFNFARRWVFTVLTVVHVISIISANAHLHKGEVHWHISEDSAIMWQSAVATPPPPHTHTQLINWLEN